MNKLIGIIAAIIVIVGGYFWYEHSHSVLMATNIGTAATTTTATTTDAASSTANTYSYECDEHVAFTMTPSDDMRTITIAPNGAGASYPPATVLSKEEAPSGVRYVGDGVLFSAQGETVTLGEGESAITCSPVQNPDMAPFNFGD